VVGKPATAPAQEVGRRVQAGVRVKSVAAKLAIGPAREAEAEIVLVTEVFRAAVVGPAVVRAVAPAHSVALPVGAGAPHKPAASAAHPVWDPRAAVVVDAGSRDAMSEGKQMNANSAITNRSRIFFASLAILVCGVGVLLQAGTPQAAKSAAATPPPQQKGFATAKQAADALIQAAKSFDVPALKEIFGPNGEDFVSTADPVQDKNRAEAFAAMAGEKNAVTADAKNPARATLVVGTADWPLPVPMVKIAGKWYFDSKAGHEEILLRRIGANELDAIQICRGYVEAQKEYASEVHEDSGINQYAQHIISSPGKHDGLAWKDADGSWGGPVGEAIAKAIEQGYTERDEPYHGYYFKILKGQGAAAPLGQLDFVIKDVMIGGFALAAAPAEYRVTGVQTFIVSHNGIVYQKDLGPDTLSAFKSMEQYNPDKSWHRTNDNW
jgi:hypothetical protein